MNKCQNGDLKHVHTYTKRYRETERKEREKIIEKYFLNRTTVGLVVRPTFD